MNDEMFKQIYQGAQEYAAQIRGELPAIPQAPKVSQDVSGYSNILNNIAQGDVSKTMLTGEGQQAENDYNWQEYQKKLAAAAGEKAKPKRVATEGGGFDFFDAAGVKISAYDYAKLADTNIVDVLKDSMNPEDQKLIRDYSGMQTFWEAAQSLGKDDKPDEVRVASVKGNIMKVQKHDGGFDFYEVDTGKKGHFEQDYIDATEKEQDGLVDGNLDPVDEKGALGTYYLYTRDNPELRKMTLEESRKKFMQRWGTAFGLGQ